MDPSDPRTYLAAERTFLAWIRTGLALMGFGFVAARFGLFLREELPVSATTPGHLGISVPAGVTLILLGVVVIVGSGVRHHRFLRALERGDFRPIYGTAFAFFIAAILAVLGVGLAIYLWGM